LKRYTHILAIALEAVLANKFRSILTALGIIFGVAAVIAMMAIGRGAKQEILDQMKVVGVNNIIITPIIDYTQEKSDKKNQRKTKAKRFSPGLTLQDAESIQKMIPGIKSICPEITYETRVIKGGKQMKADLTGITSNFFEIFNLKLESGNIFNNEQLKSANPVCIIGNSIKSKLFPYENPIGKSIKCDNVWLTVIGVMESKFIVKNASSNFGINNYNQNIYIPIQTILSRFNDRSLKKTSPEMHYSDFSAVIFGNKANNAINKQNKNQLDKIIVQVDDSKNLAPTSKVLEALLKRRHQDVPDFKVKVPELLLKQEQRTKDVFNIVLGAIASISLIVGGIGIMNIMLASILERIREIGVRLAVGARKRDIILQFLTESTLISISGGIIGILLGILLSKIIMQLTDILTIISLFSIVISFGVSAAVGILFGFMPARKAAQQDPYTSLRHD
jgi:putative ABC transport system permease protein